MGKRDDIRNWLPLSRRGDARAELPLGDAFRPEWIDFERGIRVGNLEPHERITQILKYHLESRFGPPFVIDRWGRGVFWQWICWLPKANRQAKPLSSEVNFGCAKLFISAYRDTKIFKCGLQIERGYVGGNGPFPGSILKDDWDWHRLVANCTTGSPLERELKRLLKQEGFVAEIGNWEANAVFNADNFVSAEAVGEAATAAPENGWAGFQLYYPMPAAEVKACTGHELVQAMVMIFLEVVPAMNTCMQVPLEPVRRQ